MTLPQLIQDSVKAFDEKSDIGCCNGDYCYDPTEHDNEIKSFLTSHLKLAYEAGRKDMLGEVIEMLRIRKYPDNQDIAVIADICEALLAKLKE